MSRDSWVFWLPWCVGVMGIALGLAVCVVASFAVRRERRGGDPVSSEPDAATSGAGLSPGASSRTGPDDRRDVFDWSIELARDIDAPLAGMPNRWKASPARVLPFPDRGRAGR